MFGIWTFTENYHFQFFILATFILKSLLLMVDFLWIIGNSKQRLKETSVLEIFVENFPFCRKNREALVAYGLKRYLIIYPYAASWVITICLAAAIKASHAQLPSVEKQASTEVVNQEHSPGGILQNAVL